MNQQIIFITLLIVILAEFSTASPFMMMDASTNETPAYGCEKVIMKTMCVKLKPGCKEVDRKTNECIQLEADCYKKNGNIFCRNPTFFS